MTSHPQPLSDLLPGVVSDLATRHHRTEHAMTTTEPDTHGTWPAYADPTRSVEGWDDSADRPICDGVGWDLSFGCAVTIGHEHTYEGGTPARWTACVALSDADRRRGHVMRTVTPEQVESYARQLLDLVARVRSELPS